MACSERALSMPLLAPSTSSGSGGRSGSGSDSEESPTSHRATCCSPPSGPHKPLAVLADHAGPVSCLALCGEFVLSASHGRDILVWQQPDMRRFTRFGRGDGSVKALVALAGRVFTAHQDSHIRVWKLSRSSENIFRLDATLPTARDYLGNFMNQSNYVRTRRHRRRLWIEHADTISCLAAADGLVYSGSWDKTLKVWRVSDLKCLESIRAHDDAVNALAACQGALYSASADGKIKIWRKDKSLHCLKAVLEGHKDVSWNAVIIGDGGRFVYGGGSDGRVMGWEAEMGGDAWRYKLVCDVKGHEMSVLCLCSTGEFVCSGSADKSIGIWRKDSNGSLGRVGVIRGHEGPVKCLQATSYHVGNGFMLYSGGLDKSLRVWWVGNEQAKGRDKFILLR